MNKIIEKCTSQKTYNCSVKIVDMIMGSGKSSAAINYINNSPADERIIYITPYNDEIRNRIIPQCKSKNLCEPQVHGTKLRGIKDLLNKGKNIASTHALFHLFDQECIDICRAQNYTLIMDEVSAVVEDYAISNGDLQTLLEKYVDVNEKTGFMKWRDDQQNYSGKFEKEKRLCEMNCLACHGGKMLLWLFPVEAFNAFRSIYILTYLFNAQVQRYYYDFYDLPYKYIYVSGDSPETYRFTEEPSELRPLPDFKSMIHILENDKMNEIGDSYYDLSVAWYRRNANNIAIKKLQKNLSNYFQNIRRTKTGLNLWTTYKDYKKPLAGNGYSRAFLSHNARAINDYGDRISIAYPINRFLNTIVKNFFIANNVEVDEEGYALSEMLQFIWRSAIRNGQEIWLYIPSIRMRNLLIKWVDTISTTSYSGHTKQQEELNNGCNSNNI